MNSMGVLLLAHYKHTMSLPNYALITRLLLFARYEQTTSSAHCMRARARVLLLAHYELALLCPHSMGVLLLAHYKHTMSLPNYALIIRLLLFARYEQTMSSLTHALIERGCYY